MNSAMVSLNRFWMSSMLPMFAIFNSSRIFSRRALSSGVRFFLAMCNTSCLLLLFYTSQQVYTNYGIASFPFDRPDQAWLGDITYIPTGEAWLYLAIVKNLCACKIVGYAFSDKINTQLTLA